MYCQASDIFKAWPHDGYETGFDVDDKAIELYHYCLEDACSTQYSMIVRVPIYLCFCSVDKVIVLLPNDLPTEMWGVSVRLNPELGMPAC